MEKKLPNTIDARKRLDKVSIRDNVFDINPLYQHLGDNLKYFIRTYGCQANVRDSETIAGILESLGYKPAETIEDSDLVILNTCAIRENAELKVFGEIGFLKRMKKSNHNFKFGICGCMAQEESVIKKIIDKIQYIDFAFGTHNIYELPEILNEIKSSNETCIRVNSYVGEIVENLPSVRNSTIKAFVNITYGCDKFCSYCIVPYTRGKLRSRKQEDIINEIKMLRDANYKEVTLIGQNVNSYNDGDVNFEQLLENVAKTGIERVRFATSNP
jgi:tRNA-2-methylthio-N6-dimethylallyladenosine synthase